MHVPLIRRRPTPRSRPGEAGSAYLMTLMALVVLMVIALALATTTQTEMLIGTNERMIQRSFFAAESALAVTAARVMFDSDFAGDTLVYQDVPAKPFGAQLEARLDLDPVDVVAAPPCSFCQINNSLEYNNKAFFRVLHGMEVAASIVGTGGEVVGRKDLSSMFDLEPWDTETAPSNIQLDTSSKEDIDMKQQAADLGID